mmetsp:Transcript_13584/g.48272  ORF Transcript_13584/g.48272 Transcript_13584/m.48272 type:complete len:312 (+) Transcript_13584:85-1020(+)
MRWCRSTMPLGRSGGRKTVVATYFRIFSAAPTTVVEMYSRTSGRRSAPASDLRRSAADADAGRRRVEMNSSTTWRGPVEMYSSRTSRAVGASARAADAPKRPTAVAARVGASSAKRSLDEGQLVWRRRCAFSRAIMSLFRPREASASACASAGGGTAKSWTVTDQPSRAATKRGPSGLEGAVLVGGTTRRAVGAARAGRLSEEMCPSAVAGRAAAPTRGGGESASTRGAGGSAVCSGPTGAPSLSGGRPVLAPFRRRSFGRPDGDFFGFFGLRALRSAFMRSTLSASCASMRVKNSLVSSDVSCRGPGPAK